MALIEVHNLKAEYSDKVILDDISFEVDRGEVFIISGPSGCGKTTLLSHMIGLLTPAEGDILIDGANLVKAMREGRAEILSRIGVMYQSGALFSSLSVIENVMLPLHELTHLPEAAREKVAMSKLQLVGLQDDANKYPSELSGGMIKRAAIARAMALDPCVIFLDEPSAGLDPVTSYALDQLILELSKGMQITFIIVTHEVPSIMAIADRMILLHDKKIAAEGSPRELQHCDVPFAKAFFEKGLVSKHE